MKKVALLALAAVLSLGFMGCAGSFKDPLNLPDPDQATVVGVWSESKTSEGQSTEIYVVVLEQRERFVKLSVDKATFEVVREGDTVEVELISYTLTQDNVYLLETEYLWKVGGQKYPVIFKCDARTRPTRPVPSADKS